MAQVRTDLSEFTVDGLLCEFANCHTSNLRAKWQPEGGAIGQVDEILDEQVRGLSSNLQALREQIAEIRRERDEKKRAIKR